VKGHAVLAAIACEEIILGAEAEFGAAGIDENTITPLLRAGYTEIAEQRRTVPTALALGMLDRAGRLLTVQTLEGSRVIFEHELPALEQSTTVSNVTTLKPEGEFALFTGNKWRHQLGYVSHLASDHEQLAAALKVPVSAFQENPLIGNKIEAVRVNFDGPLNPRLVDRTLKIIGNELKKPEVNLLFLWLRSEGGSLEEALRFARYLRFEIDPSRVRTVVYVSIQARGAAALLALAGDELIMEEGAVLGGEGSATLREKQLEAAIPAVRELFERRDQAWSPALGLMGRPSPVLRYSHAKRPDKQLFSAEEHAARADRIDWSAEVQPVELARGISSQDAVDFGLATHRTRRFEEVKTLYRVERDVHPAKLNWALVFIERLADRRLAGLLLFIGTFALLSELSHPGIGLPGFVASVCFLLFFWSNFLHGNADMLELLLFAAGVACLVVELFVAPGVMIFGIGGVLMIMVSIILASQTFVLPTNTYQLSQVPGSLFMVIGAGAGGLLGLFVLQRYLPHTPYFKKMMLRAPGVDEIDRVHEREKLASFEHLVGKYGETITPLVPSGKIITGDKVIDVVSDGTLIEPGQAVVIVETMGSRVVVRKA
jgi:membrane-bound ClpP family serine protease